MFVVGSRLLIVGVLIIILIGATYCSSAMVQRSKVREGVAQSRVQRSSVRAGVAQSRVQRRPVKVQRSSVKGAV